MTDAKQPAKKTPVSWIFFVVVILGLILALVRGLANSIMESEEATRAAQVRETYLANLSPEQKARLAEEEKIMREPYERAEAVRREKLEILKYKCKLKDLCPNYAKVRQDCATAGSFEKCVSVRLGDDDALAASMQCTNDGHLNGVDAPGFLECNFPDAR